MSEPHKTIRMKVWADIDIGIAPTVERLNNIPGVTTQSCCEGYIEIASSASYRPYVNVSWDTDTARAAIEAEFDLTVEGLNWGYAHPRPFVDPGVRHEGCNYLCPTGGACNKCGYIDSQSDAGEKQCP